MVISTVNQVVYNGDGVTTAWPFTFRIIDATDIKLLLIDADGTETDITANYFVDTINNTVYYPGYAPGAEPPEEDQPPKVQSGQKLVVYRELPVTQEKDLGEKWPFAVIELALDKLTMILQQIYEWWGRTLRISEGDKATHPDFDMTFPIEPGKSFRVNMEGTGFEASADPGPYAEIALEAATAANAAAEAAAAAAAGVELQAQWYDSVSDMRSANIPAGITAGTKGYYSVDDGGSSIYNIRAKTEDDVEDGDYIIFLDNGNVAEKITAYDMFNRSVLNFEYVRNEGFKNYYLYSSPPTAVYGCYMGFSETSYGTFIAMMFPVETLYNFEEGYITDKAILVEFDSDMQEIRRSGELTLYHGRNLAFYNDKIYVTAYSSGNTSVPKLVVVDYTTLTVEDEMTFDVRPLFLWFKDGYMYTGANTRVEKREIDGTLIESKTLTGLPWLHSIKPYKNMYVATANEPNTVFLLDSEFKIVKTYSLPYIGLSGEIKDIAVVGDDIYIPLNERSYYRDTGYELSECYASILHMNLHVNVRQTEYNRSAGNPSKLGTAYVDTTTTSTNQNGSTVNPFATILQAVTRGYKYIILVNSDGCYIFGSNDVAVDGTGTVHLGDVRNCVLNFRNCTVQDGVVPNAMRLVDLKMTGCTINSTLNLTTSKVISSTACTVNADSSTILNLPQNSPKNANQEYVVSNAVDGIISVDFDALADGAYLCAIRLTSQSIVFTGNFLAPSLARLQGVYFTAYAIGHTFTGYFNVSIVSKKITPTLQYTTVDGVSVNDAQITRLVVKYIP